MSIPPRWRKVLRDVLRNPTRSILVILSIAVGVIAMTMVIGGYAIVAKDLPATFQAINPSHAVLYTSPFQDDLVTSAARVEGVESAAGQRRLRVQVQMDDGRWQEVVLRAVKDFDDQSVNIILPERGSFAPGKTEVLIERTSIASLDAAIGDKITVKTADEKVRELAVVGLTHDMNEIAANLSGIVNGYITFDALQKLGFDTHYNELAIRIAGDASDRTRNEAIAARVEDKVEKAGVTVQRMAVPRPGEHQMQQFLSPMLLILGAMGILSLLLSAFLVVNIITALLAQQTRQIGVMKAIGAQADQVAAMYVGMVFLYGVLALVVALPLGAFVTDAFVRFAAGLMNFDVSDAGIPPAVVALQVVVSIGVPVLGALGPILRGTRITVREAISDFGAGSPALGHGLFDRLLERIHFLSRPLLISLRNTFRRKGRLILTLTTLTLASAIFISVFSVQSSLYQTMDDAFHYWNYDVSVRFARPYRADHLVATALDYPGIVAAESWGYGSATRTRADGVESDAFRLIAPTAGSQMLTPTMVAGRWLLPEDENAIVINSDLLKDEPDLRVGDTMLVEIDGREESLQIVGIARSLMSGPSAYINYPYFSAIARSTGMANSLNIRLDESSSQNQKAQALVIEQYYEDLGLRVSAVQSTAASQEQIANQFGILVLFLGIMALTLAIVGGLGLMGTMSINVLERRREIGVMRSIGASTFAVMQIVIVEGVLIGIISWAIGAVLALPISRVLSDAVGAGFINSELTFRYSTEGALLWFFAVALIAAVASYIPARSAAQLTVREVLAYE